MAKFQGLFVKKTILWFCLLASGLLQSIAFADHSYWLCRRSMEVRTMRFEVSGEHCVGWYTKGGVDERVADTKDIGQCKEIVQKIRTTLESAGWKCKDISYSKITE